MCKVMSIAERLKDASKGTRLWCTILEEVELVDVNWNRADYPIKVVRPDKGMNEILTKDGRLYSSALEADCILFPSKDMRNWAYVEFRKEPPEGTICLVSDAHEFISCGKINPSYGSIRYYRGEGTCSGSMEEGDTPFH